jgi:hypothetical protein
MSAVEVSIRKSDDGKYLFGRWNTRGRRGGYVVALQTFNDDEETARAHMLAHMRQCAA